MDIARSGLKVAGANVGGLVLKFVGVAFFARELGATALGTFFLFQAILGVSILPANLGTRIAVEKRISEGGPADRILGTAIVIKTVLLVGIIAAVLVFDSALARYVGADVAVYLAAAMVLKEFAGLLENVLKGQLRVGETATLQFADSVVWISAGIVLVSLDYGVFGLIYGVLLGKGAMLLWGAAKTRVGVGRPSVAQARSLASYARYGIIPGLDAQVHSWLDLLIIGFFLSQAAVGAYEVAWRVAAPLLLFSGAIGTTIFPQISSWEAEGSIEAVEELLPRLFTPALLFVFPAFFGGVLLAREVLGLIFGTEFVVAWAALLVLIAGKLPRAIRQIVGKSLLGLDRPDLVTHAAAVDILANLLLNVVLIWQLGILGAALGTTLSMSLGTVHRSYYLSRFVDIRVPYAELGWCLLSSLGMAAVLYAAKQFVAVSSLARLLAFVVAGAVLYGAFVVLYPPLRRDILGHVRTLLR